MLLLLLTGHFTYNTRKISIGFYVPWFALDIEITKETLARKERKKTETKISETNWWNFSKVSNIIKIILVMLLCSLFSCEWKSWKSSYNHLLRVVRFNSLRFTIIRIDKTTVKRTPPVVTGNSFDRPIGRKEESGYLFRKRRTDRNNMK